MTVTLVSNSPMLCSFIHACTQVWWLAENDPAPVEYFVDPTEHLCQRRLPGFHVKYFYSQQHGKVLALDEDWGHEETMAMVNDDEGEQCVMLCSCVVHALQLSGSMPQTETHSSL